MNALQQQRVQEIVERLSQLPYVNAIFLFGSQARGTARADSDIDIAVITKDATEEQEGSIIGQGNDTYDIHSFSQLPLSIQFRVIKEGKIAYLKDEKALHIVRVRVIQQYLDLAPFLKHFARRVLAYV